MATKGYRTPTGDPVNFVNGLVLKGIATDSGLSAQAFNVGLGADTIQTLYNWIVSAKAQLATIAEPLQYATNSSAIAGTAAAEIITPATLKAVLDQYVANAPANLNTLKEFATAINNDPNYAQTLTAQLATIANQTDAAFTGPLLVPTLSNLAVGKQFVNVEFLTSLLQATVLGNQSPPSAPVITNGSGAYRGINLPLTFTSVPNVAGSIAIASFAVSINGGANQTLLATDNSATLSYLVPQNAGATLAITATALDTAGKTSTVGSLVLAVSDLTISAPVFIYPTSGATNTPLAMPLSLQQHPTLSTGIDVQNNGQHASTTWTIRDSNGAVVWTKVGTSGGTDERYSVTSAALTPLTAYTAEAFFTVAGVGQSSTTTVSFTTTLPQAIPIVNAPSNIGTGMEISFSVSSTVPYPDSSIDHFDIDLYNANTWIPYPASNSAANVVLPAYTYTQDGNPIPIRVRAVGNNGALSDVTSFTILQVVENVPVITSPTNSGFIGFDHPTFTVNTWTNLVDGNTLQGFNWTVTDMANSNQLALTGSYVTDPSGAFTVPGLLKPNHQYLVSVYVQGAKLRAYSTNVTFTTTDASIAYETNTVVLPNGDASTSFGRAIATNATGSHILASSPLDDNTAGSGAGTVWLVNRTGNTNPTTPVHELIPQSQTGSNLGYGTRVAMSLDSSTIAVIYNDKVGVEIYKGSIAGGYTLFTTIAVKADRLDLSGDGTKIIIRQYSSGTDHTVVVYNISSATPSAEVTIDGSEVSGPDVVYNSLGEPWMVGSVVRFNTAGDVFIVGCHHNYTYGSANRGTGILVFKHTTVGWAKIAYLSTLDHASTTSLGLTNHDNWADINGSGNTIVAGLPEEPHEQVKVWKSPDLTPANDAPTWAEPVVLTDTTNLKKAGSRFGYSVRIAKSVDRIMVAVLNAIDASIAGGTVVYTFGKLTGFDLTGSGWVQHYYNYVPSLWTPNFQDNAGQIAQYFGSRLVVSGDGNYVIMSNEGAAHATFEHTLYSFTISNRIG